MLSDTPLSYFRAFLFCFKSVDEAVNLVSFHEEKNPSKPTCSTTSHVRTFTSLIGQMCLETQEEGPEGSPLAEHNILHCTSLTSSSVLLLNLLPLCKARLATWADSLKLAAYAWKLTSSFGTGRRWPPVLSLTKLQTTNYTVMDRTRGSVSAVTHWVHLWVHFFESDFDPVDPMEDFTRNNSMFGANKRWVDFENLIPLIPADLWN